MQANIVRETVLPALPSASGVELVGTTAYVVSDDAPLLYALDVESLAAGQPIRLFETAHFSTGRIPKSEKPDLECITALPATTTETSLLLCGSGATPKREVGFWVTLMPGGATTVYPLALGPLYALLRSALPAKVGLNLEGLAATATELWLFQRGVGKEAGNVVFRLPLEPALNFIRLRTTQPPVVQTTSLTLPRLAGRTAGLSGATWFAEQLFLVASVEDTADAIADGAVLGSMLGSMPANGSQAPRWVTLRQPNGQPYRGKVEGVAVRRQLGPRHYELLLVTDDDAGGSTALLVDLTLDR